MLNNLNVKIFADGAEKNSMVELASKDFISGLTTNPTLMRKAGVNDYCSFCKEIVGLIKDKPLSFEVFSDEFSEMERQALEISSWAKNIYVKIPITNTKGASTSELIRQLVEKGVRVNITAITTLKQVQKIKDSLDEKVPSYVSIFAGRIADTGVDPVPMMREALEILKDNKNSEVIWASPREVLNIFQANEIGCHIITVTPEIIKKLNKIGYDLEKYSLDTVEMFYRDAVAAGYYL
jgi:transaldolase